jgi:hypothetical protein
MYIQLLLQNILYQKHYHLHLHERRIYYHYGNYIKQYLATRLIILNMYIYKCITLLYYKLGLLSQQNHYKL